MKQSLKPLSFIFILTFLTSSLHAQQTTTVVRIVDGDTLKVHYWGKEESIRLIGIDTPESRVNKKTKKDAKRSGQDIKTITAMGKRATEYVESLVKIGDLITIEFDDNNEDVLRRKSVALKNSWHYRIKQLEKLIKNSLNL